MKKVFIIIFLLFILMGCRKTVEISMIVPYGSPQLAQLYMQNSDNYQVDIIQGADPLVAAFGSGSHDVIFAPTNLGAKMYQSKDTYQLLATIVWGNFYLITQREDINDIQDLNQKEIIIFGQNQTSDIIIQYILDFHDIECQVSYVDSVATAASMFIIDTNQVVMVADPSYSNLKSLYPMIQTIDLQEEYQIASENASFPQASVFIKNTLSEEKINQIQKDLEDSIDHATQNPEQAALLAIALGMDIDVNVLADSISLGYINYVSANESKSDIITYFELILDHNPMLIGNQLPNDLFYRGDLG